MLSNIDDPVIEQYLVFRFDDIDDYIFRFELCNKIYIIENCCLLC